MRTQYLLSLVLIVSFGCSSQFQAIGQEAESSVIEGVGPVGDIEKIDATFQFTEGPTVASDGTLFFTDIPANRIYRLDAEGELSVFQEPSSHANGLMLVQDSILLACQMDGQLVAIDRESGDTSVLADEFGGTRFNAPNDLVIDRQGGIYFTDPHYRAPEPWPQEVRAVYYRASNGDVHRLVDDLAAPNGVILSPDEKTLYVVPSQQKQVMAYTVESPGTIDDGRVFFELHQPSDQPDGNSGGDGLSVDVDGNLYITSGIGIQVVSPAGEFLGAIEFPERPANVTFGGIDRKTLIVTARTSVYMTKMIQQGHVFPGPTLVEE